MTETTETTEAIEYARDILNRAGTSGNAGTLAEIIGRYDHLLAEDEPGTFSWHRALYDVAQQARRAAEDLSATLSYDPIPDLARLLCAAERMAVTTGAVERARYHLYTGLGLPELARVEEAEAAIRKALTGAAGT